MTDSHVIAALTVGLSLLPLLVTGTFTLAMTKHHSLTTNRVTWGTGVTAWVSAVAAGASGQIYSYRLYPEAWHSDVLVAFGFLWFATLTSGIKMIREIQVIEHQGVGLK